MDLFYPKPLYNKDLNNKWNEATLTHENRIITIKDKRVLENNVELRSQIIFDDNTEIKIDTERRYYSPVEIEKLLKQVGFNNISFSTQYDINDFRYNIVESDLKTNYIVKAEKL